MTNADCKVDFEQIHESHLCTLNNPGEGTCLGDSGGALVLGDELVGLNNWGYS